MSVTRAPRLAAGGALLVLLWIAVYWAWEPRTNTVSFQRTLDVPSAADEAFSDLPEVDVAEVIEILQGSAAEPAPTALQPIVDPTLPRDPLLADTGQPQVEPTNPPPVRPGVIEHIVRRGDTLEAIATRYYADGSLWTVLARENPFITPDKLVVGTVLRVPSAETVRREASMPSTVPRDAQYVVKPGDTLSRISQVVYGTSRHTETLFQSNRKLLNSPDDLKPGQVLVIPPLEALDGKAPR